MDPLLAAWCSRHLGAPAVQQFFGLQRLSAVHGVRLADGRAVVVKVRGAHPRQVACGIVHAVLWRGGIPCPQPLAGPAPLAEGTDVVLVTGAGGAARVDARQLAVSAETWEGEGEARVAPMSPGEWGALLARMVALAPPVDDLPTLQPSVPWLHWDHDAPARLWPPPASHRWDPHRVVDRMDPLIPEVARRARARLLRADVAALPRVAAHGDFEAQNCRWVPQPAGGERLVIHDWDSVVALPEAALAGNSAMCFVSEEDVDVSTLEQNDAFLAGYAEARGRGLSALEWQVAHAAGAWVAAYNAAFEHLKDGPGRGTAGLLAQADERLARAGA